MKKGRLSLFRWLLLPIALFFIFLLLNTAFPLRDAPPFSTVVSDKDGEILHAFLSKDDKWRMKCEAGEVSNTLQRTILFKEDKYFFYHPGINPVAIVRAAFNNIIYNRKTSGASTITMQVARLLYPANRTYANKSYEIFRALQLEWKYSKEEILLLYLNLVPYGGNIEGVKSASAFYFGINPSKVNLSQAVILSVIPNRPTSLNPRKGSKKILYERDKWLRRMEAEKIFSKTEIDDALAETDLLKKSASPVSTPHLAVRLKQQYNSEVNIRSAIDRNIQEKAEAIAFNHHKRLALKNINNLAVLVVENSSHKVRAYIGSPDFNDALHAGQVDGCNAVRSPGSTLKPLAYAIAVERGLITPATLLEDVPTNIAGYAPENFNAKCNGMVTASKALAYSLNIPAVSLTNRVGLAQFTARLKKSGFTSIRKDSESGLSIILGGCGVKLTELAALYSSFANNGVYAPLLFLENDSAIYQSSLITGAAAYMVTEMLTGLTRPDLPNNYESSIHIPKIAWKTGTSYGRRDAWSVGYNKKYTIIVWAGNFSGEGVPELTGADMATPLLFDLFNTIDYNSSGEWYAAPSTVDFRMVCSHSGLPPGELCTDFITDCYIPGVSEYRKCNHLREVLVAADESCSYCTSCAPAAGYKKLVYDNYSPGVAAFYSANSIEFRRPPPHNTSCTRLFTENAPQITSPVNNKEYLLEKNSEQQLKLSCNSDPDISWVYWYVNDKFLEKKKPADAAFFIPAEGIQKISCSDDKGRNTDINIDVKFY
jgi:penicillin-binding protein 1C